ncbi:MAG: MaoC/PaaZ C-terminal domain-containing protein [Myxococcota bacterium]
MAAIDFESVDVGAPLEGLSIPALTRVTLARFAGAMDDYNPMHLDDKVATAAGKASVFAPGHLVMGYIGRMVENYFEGASIRRFGVRMLKLVWPGDVLTCRGVIVDKRVENGEHVVDADVWADNQRGETVAKGRVLAVVNPSAKKAMSKAMASSGIVYRFDAVATKPNRTSTKKTTSKTAAKSAAKKKPTTKKKVSKKRA